MGKKFKIQTLEDNIRLSTQELLQIIYEKIEDGYSDFEIDACGQHNIGGSVWSKNLPRPGASPSPSSECPPAPR